MTQKFGRTLGCAGVMLGLAAGAVQAQAIVNGGQVNISGATLFRDFFSTPASTNDYINANWDFIGCSGLPFAGFVDADCDGTPESVDQLATKYDALGFTTWWLLDYRGVGSVNGLAEFVNYQLCGSIPNTATSAGRLNRFTYDGGVSPIPQTSVDIAVLDVPSKWGVRAADTTNPQWDRKPTQPGYGDNPLTSYDTHYDNRLASLSACGDSLNQNTGTPDANTVFDTKVTWVAIAFVANRGTGLRDVQMSQLQTLFVTGRMPNGENLATVTRSVGSGTRNGAMNSIGVDSSWANGDNEGDQMTGTGHYVLGPDHHWDNCDGSGELQTSIQNKRLGVGYNGMPNAASQASAGNSEMLNVSKDIDGDGDGLPDAPANAYVRMSLNNIILNANPLNGWQVGGPETFVTRGDPFGTDLNPTHDGTPEIPATTGNPPMANQAAAAFIRNIMDSITGFAGSPGLSANFNMPGEYLAYTFYLLPAVQTVPDTLNPTHFGPNPDLNGALQAFVLANNTTTVPAYGAGNVAGKVPTRAGLALGSTYSDGSNSGAYTIDGGATYPVTGGLALNQRNRLAGDFSRDGLRDLRDIAPMMLAIHDPRAFEAGINWGGNPGGLGVGNDKAIPEILGDHNGDGNFDDKDVRYAADGLAIDPVTGLLDRKKGFEAVDDAWTYVDRPGHPAGNYFNTTLATGKPYVGGDSRADIAGSTVGPMPGSNPTGSDGVVDATDIDYVAFNTHWTEVGPGVANPGLTKIKIVQPGLFSAVARPMDLSADINGDLTVDQADVDELVHDILGTEYGDVNLDGQVDATDEAIINAHLGQAGGWAVGDMNGDGVVNQADHDIWAQHVEAFAAADFNQDRHVDSQDLQLFNDCFSGPGVPYAGNCAAADLDGDNDVDMADFGQLQKCYSGSALANPFCLP